MPCGAMSASSETSRRKAAKRLYSDLVRKRQPSRRVASSAATSIGLKSRLKPSRKNREASFAKERRKRPGLRKRLPLALDLTSRPSRKTYRNCVVVGISARICARLLAAATRLGFLRTSALPCIGRAAWERRRRDGRRRGSLRRRRGRGARGGGGALDCEAAAGFLSSAGTAPASMRSIRGFFRDGQAFCEHFRDGLGFLLAPRPLNQGSQLYVGQGFPLERFFPRRIGRHTKSILPRAMYCKRFC